MLMMRAFDMTKPSVTNVTEILSMTWNLLILKI